MSHEPCACCKQFRLLMYGQRPDQTDGALSIIFSNARTLHGTPEEPGGLVQRVEEVEENMGKKIEESAIALGKRFEKVESVQSNHNRILWIATGVLMTLNFVLGLMLALK